MAAMTAPPHRRRVLLPLALTAAAGATPLLAQTKRPGCASCSATTSAVTFAALPYTPVGRRHSSYSAVATAVTFAWAGTGLLKER